MYRRAIAIYRERTPQKNPQARELPSSGLRWHVRRSMDHGREARQGRSVPHRDGAGVTGARPEVGRVGAVVDLDPVAQCAVVGVALAGVGLVAVPALVGRPAALHRVLEPVAVGVGPGRVGPRQADHIGGALVADHHALLDRVTLHLDPVPDAVLVGVGPQGGGRHRDRPLGLAAAHLESLLHDHARHLDAVNQGVVVAVGVIRVGPEGGLLGVGQPVPVPIGVGGRGGRGRGVGAGGGGGAEHEALRRADRDASATRLTPVSDAFTSRMLRGGCAVHGGRRREAHLHRVGRPGQRDPWCHAVRPGRASGPGDGDRLDPQRGVRVRVDPGERQAPGPADEVTGQQLGSARGVDHADAHRRQLGAGGVRLEQGDLAPGGPSNGGVTPLVPEVHLQRRRAGGQAGAGRVALDVHGEDLAGVTQGHQAAAVPGGAVRRREGGRRAVLRHPPIASKLAPGTARRSTSPSTRGRGCDRLAMKVRRPVSPSWVLP